ncbi:MAG: type II toxin-antitoxin system VapC family toxin [Candidatus Latescibacteria bacterium]|nr:type II toxin-antitoxin system VapC family toxin [Candidatus Latescibacterota bacterium]
MAQPVLVDTDILSAILRRDQNALSRARQYLAEHRQFSLSIITQYEILRGLKAKQATTQIGRFEELCRRSRVISVSQDVVERASDLYADLRRQGNLIGDADILIAASALTQGLGVATNNEGHFSRIPELHVENWLT